MAVYPVPSCSPRALHQGPLVVLLLLLLVTPWLVVSATPDRDSGPDDTVPSPKQMMDMLDGLKDDLDGEDVIVNTSYGRVLGKRRQEAVDVGGQTTVIDWFLGIPYASPPLGELRFTAPHPPDQWRNTRRTLRFGSVCPQMLNYFYAQSVFQSENCLYLNVYVPYEPGKSAQQRYPVMVYIHGGSYIVGGSSIYFGQYLAQYGVVLVTINYRLGLLGFFTTSESDLPGNYGLLDQIEALKWVRDNIHHFRGDPEQVTIFGNSAGGSSVGLLTLSPLANGLFHHAIAESGSPPAFWAVLDETLDLRSLGFAKADVYGCKVRISMEVARCMRGIRFSQIINRTGELPSVSPTRNDFKPYVDGYVLTRSIQDLLENGPVNKVIYMTGTVKDEMARMMGGFFSELLESSPNLDFNFEDGLDRHTFEVAIRHLVTKRFGWPEDVIPVIIHQYTDWTKKDDPFENRQQYVHLISDLTMVAPTMMTAKHFNSQLLPVYVYTFNHQSANADPQWWGSFHSLELSYIFGSPFTGINVDDGNPQIYTDIDRNISRLMMRLWTNFARTGDPTPAPVLRDVKWHQFAPETWDYLHIGTNDTGMRMLFRPEKMAFWSILMQNLLSHPQRNLQNNLQKNPQKNPQSQRSYRGEMIALAVICCFLGLLFLISVVFLCIKSRLQRKSNKRNKVAGETQGKSNRERVSVEL